MLTNPKEKMVAEILKERGPLEPRAITNELCDRGYLYVVMGEGRDGMETQKRSVSERGLIKILQNGPFQRVSHSSKWEVPS